MERRPEREESTRPGARKGGPLSRRRRPRYGRGVRKADLFDFRRVFVLLMLTVAVPSLALSTFGILAIRYERAAVEDRVASSYGPKLDRLAAQLAAQLVARGAAYDPARDPALAAEVEALSRAMYPEEHAHFELRVPPKAILPTADATAEEALRQMMRSLQEARSPEPTDGFGPAVAERPLGGALTGHLLVVRLPESDSPAAVALANRVIYVVLPGLFYAAIIVGVVMTSRAVYKEARLSRLKTDFVSNVSHELRTPLTAVRLLVETLRLERFVDATEQAELLSHLDQETARLATLVDRLLDWARIESGRKVYRRVDTQAAELVKEAVAVFERQRIGAPGVISTETAPGLPAIAVDRDAIGLVLLNLLVNAHKYTGAQKQITLRTYGSGKRVALEVEDNGPGVPKSERKRVFEQFYRIDDLLSRRTEGTGLGLAICKRIVEDHGGRIEVGGEPGTGARFTVLLPVTEGA